ncbi:DUF397 domain-containing protein [Streptomyces sp. NPDC002044]|uniref:DUF397 domain-containing protein n=1 Tax=Streptomyces sp. NPDC002044 TaxID=3154662 RepID=UPI0033265815
MGQFEFTKSSYSGDKADSECVEVATNVAGTVGVRDSTRVGGPVVRVTDTAWAAFAAAVR